MKKQLTLIGLLAIIILSGCTENDSNYFDEIVKVTEIKTETNDKGYIRYYFKCNSSITSEWIEAKIKDAWMPKWIVVSINDTINLRWYEGSDGITLSSIQWIGKGGTIV